MVIGVFRRDGLAHDHGAGGTQPRDRFGILARGAACPERRAQFGRHVAGIEDVLHGDRHAVQRSRRAAVAAMLVGRLGLPHGVVAVEEGQGLNLGLDLVDCA